MPHDIDSAWVGRVRRRAAANRASNTTMMCRTLAAALLVLALPAAEAKVSHRFKTRQLVFTATPPHHLKTYCADLMCTAVKQPTHRARLADWEGDSTYDLPYSFAYVIDVAIKGTDDDEFGEYSTIMDTGSSNLGIAEEACSACGGSSTSSLAVSYTEENCIEVVYGDSKEDSTYWEGYESVTVEAGFYTTDGSSVTTETTFAAITDASAGSSSFFSGGYSGILGMGYSGIAESYYDCDTYTTTDSSTPLIDALYAAGQLDHDIFTISFCGATAPLAIGDVDSTAYTGDVAYTDAQKTFGEYYGYYLVKVTGFEVGGESLSVDVSTFNTYGGMLVDSGTTELILPTAVYIAFANKLMSSYSWLGQAFFSYESCLTSSGVDSLPDLTLELDGGVTLVLPAANYLIYYEGCYYWGVAASTMSILGNIAMQGLTVVFDREENQIGFATASCSVSSSTDVVSANPASTTSTTTASSASSSAAIRRISSHKRSKKQAATKIVHSSSKGKKSSQSVSGGSSVVVAGSVPQSGHDASTGKDHKPRVVHGKGPAIITARYPDKMTHMELRAKLQIGSVQSPSGSRGSHSRRRRMIWALAFMSGGLIAVAAVISGRRRRRTVAKGGAYQPVADADEFEM